jgi:hypothetical protein
MAHGFAVSFIRLLFKNSEEVKRTRFFSEPGSSGYEIALAVMAFVALSAASAAKRDLKSWQCGAAEALRADLSKSVLRVIGSSEQVHVVDALATTGDEGRCSLR